MFRVWLYPDIQGPKVGVSQHKISAYSDDMLFSLTNPSVSLPNLFQELEIYGALSHLKINLSKSEATGVAVPPLLLQTLKLNLKI